MGFLVFHYAVLESTNVLGRSFPTKFEFFQTGRQYEQDGKQYFPQAQLLCGEDLWRPLATRFLLKWPSLQAVQKAKPATLKTFYYLNGSRSAKLLEQRLTLVQRAVPVSDELALINTFTPPFAPWPSNGGALSGSAGKPVPPTRNKSTRPH